MYKRIKSKLALLALALVAFLAVTVSPAMAQTTVDSITTDVSAAFNTVAAVIATVVVFFLGVRFVKRIK